MATGISVKLPLLVTAEDGPYALHKDLIGVVKQNFKNLVLTTPGERIMDVNFGVGAFALLFESYNSEVKERFRTRVRQQAKAYMPFLRVKSINFDDTQIDSNLIEIAINYYITPLNFVDSIVLNLNGDSA
jgi:phage baseplate assembly protein W|tara:strand:- start:16000 stop:16389 length:390 start_codon:yes stop_codon:yes gene_type:complete